MPVRDARSSDDPLVVLGGLRALILQLADPRVAAAVRDHSRFDTDPAGRLKATLGAVRAVSAGPPELAAQVIARVGAVHAQVHGPGYDATDPDACAWVTATLADTVDAVSRRYRHRPALTDSSWTAWRRIGQAFGADPALLPASHHDLPGWMADRCANLDTSTVCATQISRAWNASLGPGDRPARLVVHAVTWATMPAPIRDRYLPAPSATATAVDRLLGHVGPAVPARGAGRMLHVGRRAGDRLARTVSSSGR